MKPICSMWRRILLCVGVLTLIAQVFTLRVQANVDVSAQAAIVMDVDSGRILFEKNAKEPLRIASITKIMTAIIALEEGRLDDQVKASRNAVGIEGSSIYLRLGETLSLEELLYGLMLRSGNDAAVAIAEHIGGSVEGFVFLMNQKAAELGMTNTVFSNPHGLDDHEEHYSTAEDMAKLTAYALKNEDFAQIAKTKRKTASLPGEPWDRVWYNKNKLLSIYPYADGVKTGYTKRAKRTLVSSATKQGQQLVTVTLNAPDDWRDHVNLYEYAFDRFKQELIVAEKEKLTAPHLLRKNGYFQAARSFTYPLTEGEQVDKEVILAPPFEAEEIEPDAVVYPAGFIMFRLNDQKIGRIPLQFIHTEPQSKPFWNSFLFVLERLVRGE